MALTILILFISFAIISRDKSSSFPRRIRLFYDIPAFH